jgi:hypothetical protein
VLSALGEPAAASTHLNRFEVERDARGYRIDATADVSATREIVWQTLTDYERLPQFIPGVSRVRILNASESGGRQRLLVEQAGELHFLFFARRVVALLDVMQEPTTRIVAHAISRPRLADGRGDEMRLDAFEGTYTLQALSGGVRLAYRARLVPEHSLPPIIGPWALRRTLQAQFEAMLAEIDRRGGAAPSRAPAR